MAAHLHDSVLQTLALIQRTDDPGDMVALARGQERALRPWLYGKMRPGGSGSLSAALDDVAAEVERTHRTRIEVVVVGDCPVDDGVRALVHACREAMVNAARHSGARGVSAYVEVEDDAVTAFVRDQGVGFARANVPADRHGIAESIEGRMERNGGVALIESGPGRGTEARLRIPRARAAHRGSPGSCSTRSPGAPRRRSIPSSTSSRPVSARCSGTSPGGTRTRRSRGSCTSA